MKQIKILLILIILTTACIAQDDTDTIGTGLSLEYHFYQFPMYDTTHGVAVYYNDNLLVKADSAWLIKRADQTVCDALDIIDCYFYGNTYNKPYWYEWRLIIKGGVAIPIKQKIFFNEN